MRAAPTRPARPDAAVAGLLRRYRGGGARVLAGAVRLHARLSAPRAGRQPRSHAVRTPGGDGRRRRRRCPCCLSLRRLHGPGPARARPLPPAPAGGGAGPCKAGRPRRVLVPAEESLFGFYARFGYRTVFTCRTETVPGGARRLAASRRSRRMAGRACASCSSMTAICPIRRSCCAGRKRSPGSSGAGLYRIETAMPSAAPRRSGTAKRCSCASCCRTARRPPPRWRTSSDAGRRPSARLAARSPSAWQNRSTERRSRSGPTSARRLSKAEHVPAPKFDGSGGQ